MFLLSKRVSSTIPIIAIAGVNRIVTPVAIKLSFATDSHNSFTVLQSKKKCINESNVSQCEQFAVKVTFIVVIK